MQTSKCFVAIAFAACACFDRSIDDPQLPRASEQNTERLETQELNARDKPLREAFSDAWHRKKCSSETAYPDDAALAPSLMWEQVLIVPFSHALTSPVEFKDTTPRRLRDRNINHKKRAPDKRDCSRDFVPLTRHGGRIELRIMQAHGLRDVGILLRLWSSQVIAGKPCNLTIFGEMYIWQYISGDTKPDHPLPFALEKCLSITRNCDVAACKIAANDVSWANLLSTFERLNILDMPGGELSTVHPEILVVEAGLPAQMRRYVYDVKLASTEVKQIAHVVQETFTKVLGYNPIAAERR